MTSYLNDSGSDDLNPITTIAGPVFAKKAFAAFSADWGTMLESYRIPQPFKMADFIRPHGKHLGMYFEMKLVLFADVTRLVNKHKLYSISVGVPQAEFRNQLSDEVCKKVAGPYAFAFLCAVLSNGMMGERISEVSPDFRERIAYIVDCGSSFSAQLLAAHLAIVGAKNSAGKDSYVGSMAFDNDARVPALQAADAVAWSSRRRAIDGKLADEFEPLEMLLTENYTLPSGKKSLHAHVPLDAKGIEKFAKPINNWLSLGVLPSLNDILQ